MKTTDAMERCNGEEWAERESVKERMEGRKEEKKKEEGKGKGKGHTMATFNIYRPTQRKQLLLYKPIIL